MWTKNNIPDQSGKTVVVTGANSGIGYETALALYEKGAHVIVACRDENKAAQTIAQMLLQKANGSVEAGILDLSSLQQVKQFADQVKAKHQHLHLLINNAGVMTPPPARTAEGFELQFGVNFLGHFALTGHLYPLLQQTPGARVVTLSSGAHKLAAAVNFNNLRMEESYDANREYAISKLANLQFTVELQRRSTSIISTAAHPGVTETGLSRHMPKAAYDAAIEQFGALMPAWQGALPALFAATSSEVKGGDYYGPDGDMELKGYPAPALMSDVATHKQETHRLWEYAQKATGVYFP